MAHALVGYTDALARIHHEGFSGFAEEAGPELLRLLRRTGIRRGLLVDLGCGSGVWARQALAAGFGVLGVDVSPGMLRIARREAPAATFVHSSLWSAEIPPCAAVTALGEALNYRFDPANTRAGRRRLFRRIRKALPAGGLFLADVATTGMLSFPSPWQVFVTGERWAMLAEIETNAARKTLARHCTSFVGDSRGRYRRIEETHRQWLYDPADLRADLEAAGFAVELTPSYGRYRLLPGRVAIVATAR